MFLWRTESEDVSVACVWWDSVVPQFNDTPGLVLCLEVKAARRAPPHGLRPLNHGGAFFRAERDGVWVTYERPNEQSAETTWSKKRKERETVNKPFGMAAAQTARMCSDEIIRWCHISQAHGKTSSRVRKWRRGLRHFQAGLHQGHGVCTFLFEKATFHKWHMQQKLCPHWKKLSHEEFYHILVKARSFFGSPAASLLHNLFWFALQVCSTNTFTVLFFFWRKKIKKCCGSALNGAKDGWFTSLACLLIAPSNAFRACTDVSSRPFTYTNESIWLQPLWSVVCSVLSLLCCVLGMTVLDTGFCVNQCLAFFGKKYIAFDIKLPCKYV